jgi:hypothetical protein
MVKNFFDAWANPTNKNLPLIIINALSVDETGEITLETIQDFYKDLSKVSRPRFTAYLHDNPHLVQKSYPNFSQMLITFLDPIVIQEPPISREQLTFSNILSLLVDFIDTPSSSTTS